MQFNMTLTNSAPYAWLATNRNGEYKSMYLIDNLGNRYDQIDISGSVRDEAVYTQADQVHTGWYVFPTAKPGAISFTLRSDNPPIEITGIVLSH